MKAHIVKKISALKLTPLMPLLPITHSDTFKFQLAKIISKHLFFLFQMLQTWRPRVATFIAIHHSFSWTFHCLCLLHWVHPYSLLLLPPAVLHNVSLWPQSSLVCLNRSSSHSLSFSKLQIMHTFTRLFYSFLLYSGFVIAFIILRVQLNHRITTLISS